MTEKRRYERYAVVLGSEIDSPQIEARFGLTQDLSQGGVRLLTLAPYPVDTRLRLKIVVQGGSQTECDARVVHLSEAEGRGMWQHEIGVEFEEPLPADVVETLRAVGSEG